MGMTITEKILARHCGRPSVTPGEFINVEVDVALANELSAQLSIVEFEDMEGAETVWDPKKVIIIPDHFTPAKDIRTAELVKKVRAFALKHEVIWYEFGTVGIEHVVLLEKGFVAPGDVVIGGDSAHRHLRRHWGLRHRRRLDRHRRDLGAGRVLDARA